MVKLMVLFSLISIVIFAEEKVENKAEGSHAEMIDKKEDSKENAPENDGKSLSDLRKEIREISQKINSRRRTLYKENEGIKNLQIQISDLQKKVNQVISDDKEYSDLMQSQQKLREELNVHYKKQRASDRISRGRGGHAGNRGRQKASQKLNETTPANVEIGK